MLHMWHACASMWVIKTYGVYGIACCLKCKVYIDQQACHNKHHELSVARLRNSNLADQIETLLAVFWETDTLSSIG